MSLSWRIGQLKKVTAGLVILDESIETNSVMIPSSVSYSIVLLYDRRITKLINKTNFACLFKLPVSCGECLKGAEALFDFDAKKIRLPETAVTTATAPLSSLTTLMC